MAASPKPIPPLKRSIVVAWPPEASFRRFTDGIATWWPLETHSVGQARAETVVFEGRVGGRIVEKVSGGQDCTWGTITAWDPPRRVAFTWHPGQAPDSSQDVEVTFSPEGSGTRLELVHTGWERLGKMARRARRAYPLGWTYVLRLWADRRNTPLVWAIDALMWALGPLQRRAARKLASSTGSSAGGTSPAR
jgi:uncharacterized protein YndB with AHSA1/START domain